MTILNTVTREGGNMKIRQTAGRDALGGFAPQFAQLNDDVLFGEVWSSDGLSAKTRSMLTVAALVSKGLCDSSFRHHVQFAKENGVTRSEMADILTHLAFYAGWPNAWAAFRVAKEVYIDDGSFGGLFGLGAENVAFARYFTGNSYLKPLTDPKKTVFMANVTFEPGCRNNWHVHKAEKGGGQMLVGVAGRGWYQEEGKPAVEILPGTVVHIPANVKHWHGAAKDSWFAHLAFEVPGEKAENVWLEPVSDEEYLKLESR